MSGLDAFGQNFGIKVLALVLAVLLWLFVVIDKGAEVTLRVPVKVENLGPGLFLADAPPQRVEVRIAGPRLILGRITADSLAITLDLARVDAGRVAFPSLEKSLKVPTGTRVTRVYPALIELTLRRGVEGAGETRGSRSVTER